MALLVDLQTAICEDNEDQADALRDALDIPLNQLSWEANEWLRGLSGDLDMLCDQEVFEPNELSEADYQRRLLAACQDIETAPEKVLTLLRKKQDRVSADVVAYFRGRAYSLLGFHKVGAVFLRRAIELVPDQLRYKVVLLGILWSHGDLEQSQPLLAAIFDDESADPNIVLLAVAIMFHSMRSVSPVDRETLGRLRQKAAKVLRPSALPAMAPSVAGFGFIILGALSEMLNRQSEAYRNYSQACRLMPGDATPFLLRGRLLFKTNEQKAFPDFRHAVDSNVSDPFPYLILAREALKTGNYAEARILCLSAIKIGGPLVQGQAYEFLAIAEARTHGFTDLADHYFQEARRLFPSDGNIQKNQETFEQARKQHRDNNSDAPAQSEKYRFDLQEVYKAGPSDLLGEMLRARSSQLWPEDILIKPPLNTRLSIAA